MHATVRTFTLVGIEAVPVEVQVSVDRGYPVTAIVGLPDKSVRESLDRIQAAFYSSGFGAPDRKVTVNLAPAALRKEGAALDLAIALGMLAALEKLEVGTLRGRWAAGELALNGEVRPVRGVLAMAIAVARRRRGELLVPSANLAEARAVPEVRVRGVTSLAGALDRLRNGGWGDEDDPAEARVSSYAPPVPRLGVSAEAGTSGGVDLAQIRGQAAARRALEVAAAGGHNLLFFGPPGSGKTLLAQRLPTILPPFARGEALESSLVHSVAGLLPRGMGLLTARPFRAPHHTITAAGLVGGGAIPRPGEVSLAHGGVLFLDEMPEFRPPVLNLLRQPVEDGVVRVVRAGRTVEFPCRFMLVGAMNPCMCGFLGHPRRPCRCTPHQIRAYRNRLSGPLLDRIDMHVEVPAVTARELTRGLRRRRTNADGAALPAPVSGSGTDETEPGCSASIRHRVMAARRLQEQRFATHPAAADRRRVSGPIHSNAQMTVTEIENVCRVDDATRALLHRAMETRSMSARAVHRALRVARTIADLAGAEHILMEHVAEAVQYQELDRVGESGW